MNDTNDVSICPACGSNHTRLYTFPFPMFRHLDFESIAVESKVIGECAKCGTIFRGGSDDVLREIDQIYLSDVYAAHDEVHAVAVEESKVPVSSAKILAEALAALLPSPKARVLDFGCFNGRFLVELHGLLPEAELTGYDVADRPGSNNPGAYTFLTGSWDNIVGPFDLVCFSHSIQYVRPFNELMKKLDHWLAPTGQIFVQTPDISKKASALLLGDLHFHFTQAALTTILSNFGYAASTCADLPFEQDITVLGAKSGGLPKQDPGIPVVENAIAGIHKLDTAVRELDAPIGGILGTTIDSSFVDEQTGREARVFVDENPEKIGRPFRGRPVLHPKDVPASATVIVPLGRRSSAVAERLNERFPASYIPI
jgi:SAM-dependent methyltransferase